MYYKRISKLVQCQIQEYLNRNNDYFCEYWNFDNEQQSKIQCYRKQYDSLLINDNTINVPRLELLTQAYLLDCIALIFVEQQEHYLNGDYKLVNPIVIKTDHVTMSINS